MKKALVILLVLLNVVMCCNCGISDREVAELDEKSLSEIIYEEGVFDEENNIW